jgi:hypothetical protein
MLDRLMQPRIVSFSNGARWLLEGWRLFRAAPIGWLALVFGYWLLMSLVSIIPLVGIVAAAVLVPPFAVGFMAAGRAAAGGMPVTLSLLFEGFRHGVRAQLGLGIVYFACLAAVLGATLLVDGGGLARWVLAGERPDDQAVQSTELYAALGTAAALYAPVMMMFWFAPVLAAWHAAPAAKALFFSFFGFLINWRAFLAYGAGAAVLTTGVPMVALSTLLLFSGGTVAVPMPGLLFPLLMVLLPTLFASFYASYRDIFAAGP